VENVLSNELEKLRIAKEHRARRDEKRRWPWVLLAILIIGGGVGAWRWMSAPKAIKVQTQRVRVPEGTVLESRLVALEATGYIIAAHKIELASKVIGRVAWVGVEMGDPIRKGQELVRLEDDEYKARVVQQEGLLENARAKLAELEAGSRPQEIAEAAAEVDQAAAQLANAESDLKRLRELGDASTVSRKEVEDAQTLVQQRQAQVEAQRQRYELIKAGPRKEQIAAQRATVRQLEGSLALSMVDLNNTVIRSPVDATVLERNVEVGEFVTTGFVGDRGAKGYVVSIADLDDLQVELDVSQNDFAKVEPNQPCWVTTDAYPDRRYNGVVHLISPEANRQKASVQVRVKVTNPDAYLRPDMNAKVAFLNPKQIAATQSAATLPAGERPAIRVPATAVRDGDVFVVEDGKAVPRAVTTGATSAGQIEIRAGLIGGEDLILAPPAELKQGDAVEMDPQL
jgi:HlyD family secretion protein